MAILLRVAVFLVLWGVLLAPPAVPLIRKYELAGVLERPTSRLVLEGLALVSGILAVATVLWLFDRPSCGTLGFLTGRSLQNALLGLGLGAGMVGLTLGLLRLFGQLDLTSGTRLTAQPLLVMITAVLFNAILQQVMVRYFQVTIAEFTSPRVGLVVSAMVFSVLHLGATRGAPLPSLNLFLAGMVLGYGYLATRDLWFPIGIHFAWNVLWGPILGLTVSGRSLSSGWQLARVTGSNLLTGGAFGVEAGLAASIATCLGLLLLFLRYG
jgi:membrane protease YdiL (CAAX protease family)